MIYNRNAVPTFLQLLLLLLSGSESKSKSSDEKLYSIAFKPSNSKTGNRKLEGADIIRVKVKVADEKLYRFAQGLSTPHFSHVKKFVLPFTAKFKVFFYIHQHSAR